MNGDVKKMKQNGSEMKEMPNDNATFNNQILNKDEKLIFNIIADKLEEPISETNIYTSLSDLGINSITFILIVVELESVYEIEFDDDMLALENANNIRTLIDYVCEKKRKTNNK